MPYTSTTFGALKALLAARLHDPSSVFWTDTASDSELGYYLVEAQRTWGALTRAYRNRGVFTTSLLTSLYDLSTVIPALAPSITTRHAVAMLQQRLIEPVSTQTWAGSEQFTLADLTGALQRRRNQFLLETGQVLTTRTVNAPSPRINRVPLPASVISVRRASWIDAYTGQFSTLWRDDTYGLNTFSVGWVQHAPADPTVYAVDVTPPVTLLLAPPPLASGQVQVVSVETGVTVDAATNSLLGIPDDWCWVVLFGALADLFGMSSISGDPLRASYCEHRWTTGLAFAKQATRVLSVDINQVPVLLTTLNGADAYHPGWDNAVGRPDLAVTAGLTLIGVPIAPGTAYGVGVDYIEPAPVPARDVDFVQVPDEAIDTVLDYAQHLATIKQGGGALTDAQGLLERFYRACGVEAAKWQAEVPDAPVETDSVVRDEGQQPRLMEAVS